MKFKLVAMIVLFTALMANLAYADIIWGGSTTRFTTTTSNPLCTENDVGKTGWLSTAGDFVPWDNQNYNCVNPSGIDDAGNLHTECCPASHFCNTASGKCEDSTVKYCSDYTDETSCNADSSNVGISDAEEVNGAGSCSFNLNENVGSCVKNSFCGCSWQGNSCDVEVVDSVCSSLGNCTNRAELSDSSGNLDSSKLNAFCGTNVLPSSFGECVLNISRDNNCTGGYRALSWTATPTGTFNAADCQNGEKKMPCPVQLPFTSAAGVIIALALIVILYIVLARKKPGKHPETAKKKRR